MSPEVIAVRRRDERVELDLALPEAAFEGHFPGFPVLPGVTQLHWVVELARDHLGVDKAAASDFAVKFRKVTTPDMAVTLELALAKGRLEFTYRAGDEVLSQGKVVL
jgi:3-hydroxymyristoyl/3-hydroxydecanoyl-(acyl carrier protein) dehydratase